MILAAVGTELRPRDVRSVSTPVRFALRGVRRQSTVSGHDELSRSGQAMATGWAG